MVDSHGRNCFFRADRLDEGTPEELVWTGFVVAGEEVDAGSDELIQTQLTVVVCVNRLESSTRHLWIEADDVEKQLELVLLDHTCTVVKVENQRWGNCRLGVGTLCAPAVVGLAAVAMFSRGQSFLQQRSPHSTPVWIRLYHS